MVLIHQIFLHFNFFPTFNMTILNDKRLKSSLNMFQKRYNSQDTNLPNDK